MKELTVTIEEEKIIVRFTKDDDGCGYSGIFDYPHWSQEKTLIRHQISIRQGQPIGRIHFMVDSVGAGCWASGKFGGVSITERDLQWCAEWALQAIKHKNLSLYCQENT